MALTQDQLVGLSKQVFIVEYLLNGLFPCYSDVVRLIRNKKREWKFNDKFEYRMLMATTNSGGTLNSQVFDKDVGLIKPGELTYGTYRATYGMISDGFDVDMMLNLETKEKKVAFENDYATRMHSLRMNVASLFKNFAIHGQFGVVHQLRSTILKPNVPTGYNPQNNVFGDGSTPAADILKNPDYSAGSGKTPFTAFTIKVPINVFHSNFKRGKLLIKTTTTTEPPIVTGKAPWGGVNKNEMYMVLDNQPGLLSLLPIGSVVTNWEDGQFLEVAQNRENLTQTPWTRACFSSTGTLDTTVYAGTYQLWTPTGIPEYTAGDGAVVGAMEGLADLFPWYTDPTDDATKEVRLGIDRGFRDQPNRLLHSTEQAGGWVVQQPNENIIDAIMRGAFLTKSTVPYADIGIWMNPITRTQMGYEEGDNVRVLRDNFVAGPIVYQRGVKTTDYQIGNQVIKEVVEDLNMPTDVIVIGPKDDIAYNCWDNSIAQIDDYIQETWGKSEPPKIEELSIPKEFLTKLDLSNRITIGPPSLTDGSMASFTYGNRIRHPKNAVSIALHEMGALFTEYPYTYTVVKLREPIADLTTV
jgi:hypothetical protein